MGTRGAANEREGGAELTAAVSASTHDDGREPDDRRVEAAPPPPTGLAATRLSDLHVALSRYEPALFAAIALLVAAVILPGPAVRSANRFFAGPSAPASSALPDAESTSPTTLGGAGLAAASGPVTVTSTVDPAPLDPVATETAPSNLPSPSPVRAPRSPTAPTPAETAPTHTVIAHGWATANAATVGSVGVPEGGLPVGRRLSEDDKLSFVRLGASSTRLVLRLHGDPGAHRFAESATVQACRVLVGTWEAEPGMSMAEAPPHDRASCSPGAVGDDGTWTFDLSRFEERTDQRGFALIPGPDAPADFQITFDAVTV